MIKLDIVNAVVNATTPNISRTKAEQAVETVFESLKNALGRGQRLLNAQRRQRGTDDFFQRNRGALLAANGLHEGGPLGAMTFVLPPTGTHRLLVAIA